MNDLDIIVPVFNEAGNIDELTLRLDKTMQEAGIKYQLIFVDDGSMDGTLDEIKSQSKKFPIVLHEKVGKRGKAYSILEGSKLAKSDFIAMIDGDLQYPPEAIPEMFELAKKYGVSVANRKDGEQTSFFRKVGSKLNSFIFGRVVLGFKCDVQSGLKVFRREIIGHIDEKKVTKWTLDMPLLHTARDLGYEISSVDISFGSRTNGKSKINFLRSAVEIGGAALKLKFGPRKVYKIEPADDSMLGAGLIHKTKRFVTHTTLDNYESAFFTLSNWQKTALFVVLISLGLSLYFNAWLTFVVIIACLSFLYFIDVLFTSLILFKSLRRAPEVQSSTNDLEELKDGDLPIYSILCPLYKEERILPYFIDSVNALDWPKNKLDVLLLLEEDDKGTIDAAEKMNLPSYIRIIVVPHSMPKTKPKACNYGLGFVKGEYVVIYDAEDRPDPEQLKKSFLGFKKLGRDYFCLQSKLNYYNPDQNFLTKLFTAEYSLWFDIILPGLQSIATTIPLGGTSNHFRTSDIKDLKGWDPFNVTEDCDLGVRLFKKGYKTAIIDSTTYEEANSNVKNWIRQRSRWIKGYFQTYLVHMREPIKFIRKQGLHAFIFQLVIGMRMTFMLINPFLWAATIAYFTLHRYVGATIESLYPTPVFYLAIISLIIGNFMYLYDYMIGCAKRGNWALVKYMFLIPFYWIMTSFAAYIAIFQLISRPHYWEKTHHGLHLKSKEDEKIVTEIKKNNFSNIFGQVTSSGMVSGSVLVLSSLIISFFNFLYNAYLGRVLTPEDFGVIALIGGLLSITQVPMTAIARTVVYKSGYLFGKYGTPIKSYWSKTRRNVVIISLIASLVWGLSSPFLAILFHTDTTPFLFFIPVIFVGLVSAVDSGFLSGNLSFIAIGVAGLLGAMSKFIFSVILVTLGMGSLVYASIPLSLTVSFVTYWIFVIVLKSKENEVEVEKLHLNFPKRFFATSILTGIASIAFFSIDVILAKVFLSSHEAGEYALLSLAGQMIYFLSTLFSQFIAPLVSHAEGAGKNSKATFYKLLLPTIFASFISFILLGLFGHIIVPLLFGKKTLEILQYLPLYCLSMVFFTIAINIVLYHQIKKQYLFPLLSFIFAVIEIAALYIFHDSIQTFVNVIFYLSVVNLIAFLFLHFLYGAIKTIIRNGLDFFGLFGSINGNKTKSEKLKILVFNWRDTKHTWAGGAENYLHELTKRWVKEGYLVTLFCGNDGGSPRYEKIDGVNVIRRGGFYTVYFWAFLYYIFKLRGKFDLIIDSENGIPFFTPLYVKEPIITIIYHVHQEIFRNNLNFIASAFARFLEAKAMPRIYKNSKIVTISKSTKNEMEKMGIGTSEDIDILHPGVDLQTLKTNTKTKEPSILYLGRLKPYKSVDTLIRAMKIILEKHSNAKLTIAGFGESRVSLEKLVKELGLQDSVQFLGKVSEEAKVKLLGESWVFAQPSFMEGWGMSVIEANACGTPVVASNVTGLRDSVRNPETGYLVQYGDPEAFATKIEVFLENDKIRKTMEKNSVQWAKKFSWDAISKDWLEIITQYVS